MYLDLMNNFVEMENVCFIFVLPAGNPVGDRVSYYKFGYSICKFYISIIIYVYIY